MEQNLPVPSQTPVVLLAGANTYQDRIRKQFVVQEKERIARIFTEKGQAEAEIVSEDPAQGIFLFDLFRKYAFDESVKVLHIIGYARGEYLHFEGGLGEEAYDVKSFIRQIEKLPGLEVVFVNGCATPEFLEALLLANIPAVMVTQTPQRDRSASQIAQEFYHMIADGYSVRDAIEKMRSKYGQKFGFFPVVYDFEQDALRWEGKRKDLLQWGIYMLESNKQSLDFHLPVRTDLPAVIPKQTSLSDPELPQRSRRIRLIGSGILVAAFLTMLVLLLQGAGDNNLGGTWIGSLKSRLFPAAMPVWAQDCQFNDSLSYNVLLLPFAEKGDCQQVDPYYTLAISRRLRRMAEEDTELKMRMPDIPICMVSEEQGENSRKYLASMIRDCDADLIISGTYQVTANDAIDMDFQFMYEGLPNQATLDRLKAQFSPTMLDIGGDKFVSAVDDMVYWARGMSYFKRKSHHKAIEYLLQMRERQDKGYAIVDMRLAQCYEHIGKDAAEREDHSQANEYYQQAIKRLDHALLVDGANAAAYNRRGNVYFQLEDYNSAIEDFQAALKRNPDYAEAYYNLGSLFLILKKYQEAEEMLAQATLLHPDQAEYHGALAAAYAELEQRAEFYQQLELALQKGFDMKRYPQAFGVYRSEDRFRELIAQY
ncbi:MAG: tetratricopeptide repeat protein [Bacteroidia bacterium]